MTDNKPAGSVAGLIEAEARQRFAWAWPPHSDAEDRARAAQGKSPRDWEPTRRKAVEQVAALRAIAALEDRT